MTPPSPRAPGSSLLRVRGGAGARVGFFELFFDLVFVFAVTQLSHRLLEHLTVRGAAEALLLLLALWWAWMYTSWTTNWFDPEHPAVRIMLAGMMLAGLFTAAMLPKAFEDRALWFVAGYLAVQLGRTLFVVAATWRHELARNFQRVLFWMLVAAVPWIAGALADDTAARAALWTLAVAIEYTAPSHGYATPLLGRSRTSDWNIDGGHMAERCQLFVIIALGESLLITGATFAKLDPTATTVAAFASALVGAVALWWIYFNRTAEAAAEHIAASDDPGRIGRDAYTYVHIVMVAGIIVAAVADELLIAHPDGHVEWGFVATAVGGPALFVAGHALFKRVVFGHFTTARLVALAVLAALAAAAPLLTPLVLHVAATGVVVGLAVWDTLSYRRAVAEGHAPVPEPLAPLPGEA
ncbi:low temperature requirement protein A [Actinomadura kijaniata]|uniref:low temperature requirement protein A n=1 Tax=Actinomadura kijaniata TaxID=46161 RepID=UPI000AB2F541|nr:low temperature requirement protein A [Actinomadura kijaniata]